MSSVNVFEYAKAKKAVKSGINEARAKMQQAKAKAEADAALAIYNKILDKIKTPSTVPSQPGSPPKRKSGRLYRGTVRVAQRGFDEGSFQIIGFQAPASHAHLLEFGTPYMAPRPFFMAAYQETEAEAKGLMQRAIRVEMERKTARRISLSGVAGFTQEMGARYHEFSGSTYVFDIHIDFYRAGSHIGYSLSNGLGQVLSSEDFVGPGLTFNDLIPDAIEEAKRLSGK